MRGLTKINGNGEQRARVSDELRQLKQMSKGLRTKAMRALLERHAASALQPSRRPAETRPPRRLVAPNGSPPPQPRLQRSHFRSSSATRSSTIAPERSVKSSNSLSSTSL